MTIRVLFVCLGNICRSPMAEGVFRHLVEEAGLAEKIEVDSAGTSDWHVGEPAHEGTRHVLKAHGIAYDGRSRQVTRQDFYEFDYIVAMDSSNLVALRGMRPVDAHAKLAIFLSFAEDIDMRDVPDPYYSGRFEYVYGLVERGARALLDYIREHEEL